MHDHRAGNVIAQAFALRTEQGTDNAHAIQGRNAVDNPQQVACDGLVGGNGPARVLDDPQPRQALAGRLPVPDGFEQREVSRLEKERPEHHHGQCPCTLRWHLGASRTHGGGDSKKDQPGGNLKERIQRQRQKPAADSSEWKLKRDLFGRIDNQVIHGVHHD